MVTNKNNYFDIKNDALKTFSDNVNSISVMLPQLVTVSFAGNKNWWSLRNALTALLLKLSSHIVNPGPG